MSVEFEDEIKIGNINRRNISEDTYLKITGLEEEYRDMRLKEHLYSVDEIAESLEDEGEIAEILSCANEHDVAYIRIIM